MSAATAGIVPDRKGVTIAIEPRVVGLEVAAGMYGISADQITELQRRRFPVRAHRPPPPRTGRPGRRLVRRPGAARVGGVMAPLAAWVPWAATALFLAAVTAYWAWPRVANRKRHRR